MWLANVTLCQDQFDGLLQLKYEIVLWGILATGDRSILRTWVAHGGFDTFLNKGLTRD